MANPGMFHLHDIFCGDFYISFSLLFFLICINKLTVSHCAALFFLFFMKCHQSSSERFGVSSSKEALYLRVYGSAPGWSQNPAVG